MIRKIFLLLFIAIASITVFAQQAHVPGELLVQFSAKAHPEMVTAKYARADMSRLFLGKCISRPMGIYKVHFNPESIADTDLLRLFRNDPEVLNAQFNHYISKRETVPNDPSFGSQWHHVNDGSSGTADADIDSDLAWDITTGGLTAAGDTIVACVIEGGNLNHVDLIDNAWFNHHEIPGNGIDDDNNGYIDDYRGWNVSSDDDEGLYNNDHGTSVLGMIGASGNNETGVSGINWNIKLMVVGGENANDEASVVEAYTYPLIQRRLYDATGGEQGAFVVVTNASWGIDNGNPADVPVWAALYDTLGAAGILNCGATTNSNTDVDQYGDIPTAVPSDYMISVTATNNNDLRTYSGYGQETIDLAAPGTQVRTTSGQAGYGSKTGTSFASPLTAGVVALLYSAPCNGLAALAHSDPQLAADFVRNALLEGVDPVPNLATETVTGGRLNAFNSLMIIQDACESGLCIDPFSLSYQVTADTVYTFAWGASAGNAVTLRFRLLGDSVWTTIPDISTGGFTIDTLQHCALYEFSVAGSCSGIPDDSQFLSPVTVATAGCCVAPADLVLTAQSDSSLSVAWTPGLDIGNYTVAIQAEGDSEWITVGSSTNGQFTVSGLDSCTVYQVAVQPACSDSVDPAYIEVKTTGCGYCIDTEYCATGGESSWYEYIDKIQIGDFDHVSGNDGGYALFEDAGLELMKEVEYPLTFTPGFGSFGSYSEYFTAWIDLNRNGVFEESEIVYESSVGSTQAVTGTIEIPDTVATGSTRMRVAMKAVGFGSDQPPVCGTYTYGETEDYCLSIVEEISGVRDVENHSELRIYPNPGKNSFTLIGPADRSLDAGEISLYDLSGKRVYHKRLSTGSQTFYFSGAPGLYLLKVMDADGRMVAMKKWMIID